MMAKLRLYFLTAVVTCMIWITADQQVTKTVEMTLPLVVKPVVTGRMNVQMVDPNVTTAALTFRGPNQAITHLRNMRESLQARVELTPRPSGQYELNLLEELRNQDDLFPPGVVVTSVFPATTTVIIDQYLPYTIPVRFDPGQLKFEGEPQVEPNRVSVLAPELAMKNIVEEQRVLVIPAAKVMNQDTAEGQQIRQSVAVPLELNGISLREATPKQVTVTATLKQRTRQGLIRTVPIHLRLTPNISWGYKILLDGGQAVVTRSLKVEGPTATIDALEENPSRFDVFGYVEITSEDVRLTEVQPGEKLLKQPKFVNLPNGIKQIQDVELVEVEIVPVQPAQP